MDVTNFILVWTLLKGENLSYRRLNFRESYSIASTSVTVSSSELFIMVYVSFNRSYG